MIALRSARLVLDAPREADIDAVLRACQDPEILRWIPLPHPYTRESAEFFVRSYGPHGLASGSYTVWALRPSVTSLLVGVMEVRKDEAPGSASIGCWLTPDARGAGYMREALARVVQHAFDPAGLALTRLRWESLIGNGTSRRLAESAGFAFDPAAEHTVDFLGEPMPAEVGVLDSAGRAGGD
ncbi:GNAT family N-acetyltransferase [Leifsonia sp. NPDC058292]|uniref:GNAT family N-acetyltransferase n=1 Tax=Leifsonia sp. NPDC058292 TaxID=3346428 RepID=UPI0036DADDA4